MKKTLLFASLLLTGLLANAQSFEVTKPDGTPINGGLITVAGGNGAFSTLSGHVDIKNVGASSIETKIKRYETSVVAGSENYFCWFVCYGAILAGDSPLFPTVTDPQYPHFRTIEADSTDPSLVFYHKPEGTTGTSTYRYVVFDGNNENDSAYFDVEFVVGFDGIEDNQKVVTNHYPNPANSNLNIAIDVNNAGNLNLVVTDLLGKTVESRTGLSNKEVLDVNNYKNGIYFYSILNAKGILTSKKFIVRH